MASLYPEDVTLKVGIINPNGSKLYVNGKDMVSHSFSATATGQYRVYVENKSDVTISIEGLVSYSD